MNPVPVQMSLPVRQTASVLELVDRHVRSNPLTRGLTICTGALRRCLAGVVERDRIAAEKVMQLELMIEALKCEDERKQSRVLHRLAEIKGLLCCMMLTAFFSSLLFSDDHNARRITRRLRKRDEVECVEMLTAEV